MKPSIALRKEWLGKTREIVSSEITHAGIFFDDLRRAASHMALVSLVTRLDHWTRKFVKKLKLRPDTTKRPPIVRSIEALNNRLGAFNIPVELFEELVTVRDSIIHGDSQAQWEYQGQTRRVKNKYVNQCGELNFTEQHLREAIDNVTKQVKWYCDKVG